MSYGHTFSQAGTHIFFSSNYIEHLETMFTEMTHDNDVRIPGARRHELREKFEHDGIEVPQDLIDRIKAISKGEVWYEY